jgi:quercetin dioxygenase-like cupin family protein
MQINDVPFGVIDWSSVEPVDYPGTTGKAVWRTREFGGIRARMVEYSAGYLADHWCSKGHVVLVLEGEFESELADGRKFRLTAGMSYQVADNAEAHRSFTATGVKLFIVD